MTRPFTGILVATLLLLLVSCRPADGQLSQVPHENPAMVSGEVDAISLLHFYGNISGLLASRQYQEAQKALDELRKGHIPASIADLFESGTTLSQDLVITMSDLEFLLNSVYHVFSAGEVGTAGRLLTASKGVVIDATLLTSELTDLSEVLGARMGVGKVPRGTPLPNAYEAHLQNLAIVADLISELDALREKLVLDPVALLDSRFYISLSPGALVAEELQPGIGIRIGGKLYSLPKNPERILEVYLNEILPPPETAPGEVTPEIPLPSGVAAGRRDPTVVAVAGEDDAGTALPLTDRVQAPIELEIQTSWLVVIPRTVHIEGTVRLGFDPLPEVQLHTELGSNSAVAKAAADGTFSAEMEIPFSLTLAGPRTLRVTATTLDGDYAPVTVTKWVLVVNPVYGALLLLVFLIAAWFIYRRLVVRTGSPITASVVLPLGLAGRPAPHRTSEPDTPPHESDTAGDRVLAAYLRTVETVRIMIGTAESPSMTLREYARTVALQKPQIYEPFTDLTSMVEAVLYSTRPPDESTADRAETSAGMIRQEITREAA